MPGNGEKTRATDKTTQTNPVQPGRRPIALGWIVFLATGVALVLGALATVVFAFLAAGTWPWDAKLPLDSAQWYDVTRSSIATVGLIGLGGGAILAYRRQQTTERLQRTTELLHELQRDQQQLDRDRHSLDVAMRSEAGKADLRTRYATAAAQLGHAGAAVRLSGVYALAALADDWHEAGNTAQQNVCIDVLCAYLRMRYVPYDPDDPTSAPAGEREVRLTVISVIRNHLLDPDEPNSWCDKNLDFTDAHFDGGSFESVTFHGGAIFTGAKFSGGDVLFMGAKFSGANVNFTKAQFSGGSVNFNCAKFSSGTVDFGSAEVSDGYVNFSGADFSGADVLFGGTKFSGGTTYFAAAKFSGGNVNFTSTEFSGGSVYFSAAKFTGGSVLFAWAKFSAGGADFTAAEFSGGSVDFRNAKGAGPAILQFMTPVVWDVPPVVPWQTGSVPSWVRPDQWPPPLFNFAKNE